MSVQSDTDPPRQVWIQSEPELSLDQTYRLVVIAHKTSDPKVRAAALWLIDHAMHPLRMVAPDER